MRVEVVQGAPKMGRKIRNPQHSFNVLHKPYFITPFLVAPVLPGETLNMAMIQARGVLDPIKNPLIGWWTEYYFFYVKHRHMPQFEALKNMVMLPGSDISSLTTPANQFHYYDGVGPNWVRQCIEPVVREFFRDQDEQWDIPASMLDGLPMAKIKNDSWLDSAKTASAVPDANDTKIPGQDFVSNDQHIMPGFEQHYAQWEHMRALKMTDATYEDWLQQFGIKAPVKEREDRPELLRQIINWQYPVNTVNPTDGKPTSAVSWAVSERMDKPRSFNEPGFIFGVTVIRPKVYRSAQTGPAAKNMSDAYSWLPAMLRDDPYTTLRQFAAGAGVAGAQAEAYWVDVADLMQYGDQFTNFALNSTDAGFVASPKAGMQKDYVDNGDIMGLFVNAVGAKLYARQDGVVTLNIKSALMDTT